MKVAVHLRALSPAVGRIAVAGDITPETASPLYAVVKDVLLRCPRRLELDLHDARILDGDGLFILLDLDRRARANHCALVLTRVPPAVMMLIDGTLIPALVNLERDVGACAVEAPTAAR